MDEKLYLRHGSSGDGALSLVVTPESAGWAYCGLRVLRFWNGAVFENRDGVCLSILDACGGDRDPGSSMPL